MGERAWLDISCEVATALAAGRPVVALETVVVTHGLPAPTNLETALAMEGEVRRAGAVPATIGLLNGWAIVGMAGAELERLVASAPTKASVRDLPVVVARGGAAGTTVAATAYLARAAGIHVVATGGIGGVHRGAGASFDVSADLATLARTPIALVCAGAKTVLDLAATLEWLETAGVPVVGYGTDELPGFVVGRTGLRLAARAESPGEVAAIYAAQRALGMAQALVVAVPAPAESAMAADEFEALHRGAEEALARVGVSGKDVTPFLLGELRRRSDGATLRANVALLANNARVGAHIAVAMRC